ncbi:MAG: hypothetical protein ACP5QX_01500 [Caldisericaceae bacterium]
MDALAVIIAAVALILSSLIKETYLNVLVYVSVGVVLIFFGLFYPKPFARLLLRVILGILLIIFVFVKSSVTIGRLHTVISVLIAILALYSILIKK